MRGFIEVHVDGEPLLINVAQITDVAPLDCADPYYQCRIQLAQKKYITPETYEEVKALIEEAQR